MRTYELLFIVQPQLEDEELEALIEQVRQVITNNGGEVIRAESMGRQRLAYAIRKRTEGFYVLAHAKMERTAILELERFLKLSEDVLRHMLIRLDETINVEPETAEEEMQA